MQKKQINKVSWKNWKITNITMSVLVLSIWFVILFWILLSQSGCSIALGPGPDCYYSDECPVNHICSKRGVCEKMFSPPGFLTEGSMTSYCVLWNNSFDGMPVPLKRANPWCISGMESAESCKDNPFFKDKPLFWFRFCL